VTRGTSALPALLLLVLAALTAPLACGGGSPDVRVGSKKFTESVLLGEMVRELAANAGASAVHRRELGGTRVLWNALQHGDIDVYPEYTGTIGEELLGEGRRLSLEELRARLARRGVHVGRPLGFDNTYAIGMRAQRARALGLTSISQLAAHPTLRFGFTSEFMDRADGWPGLRARYGLRPAHVRGLDHDLAYRGLASGDIDVTDLYSTDAEIPEYDLRVLRDDLGYFPEYQAVLLYRQRFVDQQPAIVTSIERLAGTLDAATMQRLNAQVKVSGQSESEVSARFLEARLQVDSRVERSPFAQRLLRTTLDHLALVAISLGAAVVVALPLGILAARRRVFGQLLLSATGVLQTIPSLALLVFMIPLLGIGAPPAIAALFLYSLLPIVRNTHAGLHGIAGSVLESAQAIGLPPRARLWRVELPLAAPSILAGIKTAAVINVGTATLGALIGAGGYGQPILTGIRLDDNALILQGAIPAAVLALLVQGLFDLCERWVVPRGLRL
jgi:osmoprotectant transport system permease protein